MSDKLYTIEKITEISDGSWSSEISINKDSKVFEGHFPGQPVLPGVFMLEIIASVLSEITAGSRKLIEGDNIKFLSVLDPGVDSNITVTMNFTVSDERIYSVKSELSGNGKTFLKFKGKFL
jgi:3-hydroxyacyl-[acyl-carrier-protein] dehydratase